MVNKHILLKDLEVYKLARELSKMGWKIYNNLTWQDKKIMGDQFITATDSFGANVAEGYSRYHYLDKKNFSIMLERHLLKLMNTGLKFYKNEKKQMKIIIKNLKKLPINLL